MLLSNKGFTDMIGHEENQEEVSFKVTDRRKFNADGTVKDGVELTAKPVEQAPLPTPAAATPEPIKEPVSETVSEAVGDEASLDEPLDEEMPGADDPASFVNFLSTLATNAAAALGAVPHPATGKRSLDLDTGKYWLDVLAMIKDKTNSNLHAQESHLLDGLLADLRMQYVTMVRATEEKLKTQAAQKFGSADILGKK
jgi:hypothetical protein